MLRFEKVCKSYGSKRVLNNASHDFGHGAFALRGPNGIGKSTLLKILAGTAKADSGAIRIDGISMEDSPMIAKARLSYVPDECPVYPFMTGTEFLKFVAHAKHRELGPKILEIAARFGLSAHLDTRFSDMSLGTQKKTMLTAAWIGDPVVMLFDEPSNGLDLPARDVLIELLKGLRNSRTMLISTHDEYFVKSIEASIISFDALSQNCLSQEYPEGCLSN